MTVFNLGRILCALVAVASIALPGVSAPAAGATTGYLMWQMPATGVSYPIYVYSGGAQVGYIYSASQQAFVGSYDPAATTGAYQLYYQNAGTWYGCAVALKNGVIDPSATSCPGMVINAPVATSNVYSIGPGAVAWPQAASAPANPTNVDYSKRGLIFVNKTKYQMIQLGEVCTLSVNPNNANCENKENRFQIKKGGKAMFLVDGGVKPGETLPGLTSYAFLLSAYMDGRGNWVKTGGYGKGEFPYATKIEGTFLDVPLVNGAPIPKGASNFDVSAVDGYNIKVRAYPLNASICTYTVPPENSNVLGAGTYSQASPLAVQGADQSVCQKSSQMPAGQKLGAWKLSLSNQSGEYQGCMSPCTYAKKNYAGSAQVVGMFCCSGNYGTPATCDQPAGKIGANNSTYVTNMAPPVTSHVYRFAYDDAVGDFACPAETVFVVEFY